MMRLFLFPFSVTYAFFVGFRNLFYDIGFFKTKKLPCCVISIGNLTVGGTGKTPTVIALVNHLLKCGISVAVLSRGYGRNSTGTVVVSDGNNILQNWQTAGDEPILMAKKLPCVPVVVDENRFRGGMEIVKKFNPKVIILDDGFQHRALHRDINILLVNSQFHRKDNYLLPAGNLRESWSQIARSDMIFLTKTNLFEQNSRLAAKLNSFNKPVVNTTLELDIKLKTGFNRDLPLSTLKNKRVLAVSALGSPKGFEQSLSETGAVIADHLVFRDHHKFTKTDIEKIHTKKVNTDSELIITTEKDFIKLKPLVPDILTIYALPVMVVIPEGILTTIISQVPNNLSS